MKRTALILALPLAASCTVKAPLYPDVVRSEMARCPEASYIDGQQGTLKWNYTTGLELKAMLDAAGGFSPCEQDRVPSTGTAKAILDYVDAWYDAIIDSTGTIGGKYKRSNYSLDHICPGRTLFKLYDITGKEKYRMAMDSLYVQLKEQPRNAWGGFWHKKIYPDQMWLDGLYMAQPFYAEYTFKYIPDSLKAANYADIVNQFNLTYKYCFDPDTGLLRHAWDASRSMFWCDAQTGQSAHVWGRALGWYCMALVDVMETMSFESNIETGRNDLEYILLNVLISLLHHADPATGLWYQVLDCPGREGNYLEASCNAMFSYSISKAVNMGVLDETALAKKLYKSMISRFVNYDKAGLVNLNQCCEVAGLGGKDNRSGDYDYYIHERIRANDPKGIGPLIWASIEYEKICNTSK